MPGTSDIEVEIEDENLPDDLSLHTLNYDKLGYGPHYELGIFKSENGVVFSMHDTSLGSISQPGFETIDNVPGGYWSGQDYGVNYSIRGYKTISNTCTMSSSQVFDLYNTKPFTLL